MVAIVLTSLPTRRRRRSCRHRRRIRRRRHRRRRPRRRRRSSRRPGLRTPPPRAPAAAARAADEQHDEERDDRGGDRDQQRAARRTTRRSPTDAGADRRAERACRKCARRMPPRIGHHDEQRRSAASRSRSRAAAPRGCGRCAVAASGSPLPTTPMIAIDAGVDAGRELVLPEQRRDRLGDDPPRRRVGQHAFESVADLDAQLAVVLGDHEQRAVVLALAADLPRFGDANRIRLDRLRAASTARSAPRAGCRSSRSQPASFASSACCSARGQRAGEIGDARATAAGSARGRRCPPPTPLRAARSPRPAQCERMQRQRAHGSHAARQCRSRAVGERGRA